MDEELKEERIDIKIEKETIQMDKEMEVEFKLQPLEVSSKSACLYSYNPNSNQNHSKIIYFDESSRTQCKLLVHFSFQMSTIADFVIFAY